MIWVPLPPIGCVPSGLMGAPHPGYPHGIKPHLRGVGSPMAPKSVPLSDPRHPLGPRHGIGPYRGGSGPRSGPYIRACITHGAWWLLGLCARILKSRVSWHAEGWPRPPAAGAGRPSVIYVQHPTFVCRGATGAAFACCFDLLRLSES